MSGYKHLDLRHPAEPGPYLAACPDSDHGYQFGLDEGERVAVNTDQSWTADGRGTEKTGRAIYYRSVQVIYGPWMSETDVIHPSSATDHYENYSTAGVWVAYYPDWSGSAIFRTEVEALRHAIGNSMLVKFCPWGELQ